MYRVLTYPTVFVVFCTSVFFILLGCGGGDQGGGAQQPGPMYNPALCAQAIEAARQAYESGTCPQAWDVWDDCIGPAPCQCPFYLPVCSLLYDDLYADCGCGLEATEAYAAQEGDQQVLDSINQILGTNLVLGI